MTFQQYAGLREQSTAYNEGIIKAMFNAQYRALPDDIRNLYDLMAPEALKKVEDIQQSLKIPLEQAIRKHLQDERLYRRWQGAGGPPRPEPTRLTPAPHDFSQWPGIKPYRR